MESILTHEQITTINNMMGARKYKELCEYLDRLLKEQENPQIYNIRGICMMDLRKYSLAEKDFRKAISLKKEPVYYSNLADSLIMQKRYAKAKKELEKAFSFDKNHLHAYAIMSKLYAVQGKLEKAINVLDAALKHYPDNQDFLKRKEQLMAQLLALKRTQDFEQTLVDQAYSEIKKMNYTVAINICTSSLKIRETKEAYNALGICYINKGNLKQALLCFKKAYSMDKKFLDALRNIASCYLDMNNLKQSLAEYNKLLALWKDCRWYYERSYVHMKLGNLREALADVEKAISLGGVKSAYLVRKADILLRLKRQDDAVRELTEAVRLDPFNTEALRRLSEIESIYRAKSMFR